MLFTRFVDRGIIGDGGGSVKDSPAAAGLLTLPHARQEMGVGSVCCIVLLSINNFPVVFPESPKSSEENDRSPK